MNKYIVHFSKNNNNQKPAEVFLLAQWANSAMEQAVTEIFNLDLENKDECCNIRGDSYDDSLEIDLINVDYNNFKLTNEQRDEILSWGCSRFWINFYGPDEKIKLAEIYAAKDITPSLKIFK